MLTLFIILVVLLLILYVPIIVKVHIKEETSVTIFLFFIPVKINLGKTEKEENKSEKKVKKKKKHKQEEQEEQDITVTNKGGKLDDVLKAIRIIKKIIGRDFKPVVKLLGGIYIYNLNLYMTVSGGDASEIAMNYGRLTGAINYVLATVGMIIKIKPKKIDIVPNFAEQEDRFELSFCLRTTLAIILMVTGIIAIRGLKAVISESKNEDIDIKFEEDK